ncbi:MAG: type II secretion system protein GspM [Pseudomonadota bacterium]
MLENVKAWWFGRAPRERGLLMVFSGLLVVLLYSVLVVSPAYRSADTARADYGRALQSSRLLLNKAALIETAGAVATKPVTRGDIEASLAASSLAAQSIVQERGGALRMTFQDVAAAQLTKWMTSQPRLLGVQLLRFDIQRGAPGLVSATLIVRMQS